MGACLISSVENGVVIASFSKDYELSSWNEQGVILQKEGMLTVCFSYISLCSRIDRKELYLIVKMHYLVDMSTNEYVDVKNNVKVVKHSEPLITPELYHQQNEKIQELSFKINRLESEIEQLKKENLSLKEQLGIVYPRWQKKRDLAWRINPITKEIERYKLLPIFFDEEKVDNLDFYGEKNDMYRFKYTPLVGNIQWHTIPISLYEFLCGRTPKIEKEKEEPEKMDIHSINNLQDVKKFIHSVDKNAKTHRKYFNQTFDYLLHNRGSRLKFEDFKTQVKFSGRQIGYDLLRDFEQWGFIKKVLKRKGYWDVIF